MDNEKVVIMKWSHVRTRCFAIYDKYLLHSHARWCHHSADMYVVM